MHIVDKSIRLIVFDLAGTLVDHGSRAPAQAFVELFSRHGVTATEAQARRPMGMNKRDHIRCMLQDEQLAHRWRQVKGEAWTDADVETLYGEFIPLQLAVLPRHTELIADALTAVQYLQAHDVAVAITTGYDRKMTDLVLAAVGEDGAPDCSVCATEVPAGRPAPWMIFECMRRMNVYPGTAVVKIGDTLADVHAGLNASVWSVGVARTGNLIGLSAAEFDRLSVQEQARRLTTARTALTDAGAHAVIDTVAELPDMLPALEARLARGERP